MNYNWNIFTGYYVINNVIYTNIELNMGTDTLWYEIKLPNKKFQGPFHGRTAKEFEAAKKFTELPQLKIGKYATLAKTGTGLSTEYYIL